MSEDIKNAMTAPQGRHPLFWLDLLLPVLLLALLTPLFHIFDWDMELQRWWFHSDTGWETGELGIFQLLYRFGNLPALILSLGAVFVLIRGFSSTRLSSWRKMAIYLIAVMIIGPGLLVNTLLKDRWGRPRPRDVVEFGGKYAYEAPLQIDPTSPGKSFPCGHATMGFFFFAPAFLLRKWRRKSSRSSLASSSYSLALAWFAGLFGILIGIARMAQGGHFASDVVWAGTLVWIVAAGLYYLMRLDVAPFSRPRSKGNSTLKTGWKLLFWLLGLGLIAGVGVATPYQSRRGYNWADRQSIILKMAEGDLNINLSDRSSLKSVSSGFGFPGSKMKWSKRLTDSDSLDAISFALKRTGFFTEMSNETTLLADSVATRRLSVTMDQGDLSFKGRGMEALSWMELRILDGDLELLLPADMAVELAVEQASSIQNLHPHTRIVPAGSPSQYRLFVPRGILSVKSADK